LHGYAGSIHELSQLAMTGKLRISPKRIFVGGDKLTKNLEEDIGRAWATPVYDLYSASESTYIAYRQSGEHEMSVTEELNILEVLDEANRSVAENQQGVYQNQRNVLHFVRTYTNYLRLNANDRLSLFSSYAYDAAVVDIFAALLNGATLHPWDVREQGLTDIFVWIARNNITIYHSTPTLFEALVATPTQENAVASIRVVVLGGEPVSKKHVSRYRSCFNKECSLVNLYGSSESSINLLHRYNHQNDGERDFLPIGCPVEGRGYGGVAAQRCR
jgi:phenylacetate-coenzyme A ligase PaaK-like adenylate-forming protein